MSFKAHVKPNCFNIIKFICFGKSQIVFKHYQIELKNKKAIGINIVLYDCIPIHHHKDMEFSTYEWDKGIDTIQRALKRRVRLHPTIKKPKPLRTQ